MIVAVVGAPTGPAGERLARQLAGLPDRVRGRRTDVPGAGATQVLPRLAGLAREAAENGEGLAVVPGDLVASDRLLLDVLDDPRATTRLLVAPASDPASAVRVRGTAVVAAGTGVHALDGATHDGLGLLHVRADDAATAADAWTEAAAQGWDVDPFALLTLALVRRGVAVSAVATGPYVAGRDAALLTAAETLDEDDLAWRRASRGGDGVWSTFALRPLSRRVSRRAVRAGWTPNQVTVVGFVLALLAAALVATGAAGAVVVGALLLQVALIADCVDGEIARSTRRFTPFGAWLDLATDRVKEFATIAAVAAAGHGLWPLAVAALALQVTRHMADYAFADTVLADWRRPRPDTRPLTDTTPPPPDGPAGDPLGAPSGRGVAHWVKQAIHMQIGERWLVLSVGLIVGVVAGGPGVALVAYLVTVGAGLAWVLLGWTLRTLRSPRRRVPLPDAVGLVVTRLRDDGLLGRDRPARRPAVWLLAPLVAAIEGSALLVGPLLADRDALPWAFATGFAVAWHRYDVFYRARGGRRSVPRWVTVAAGGWLVRAVVVTAAALVDVSRPVLIVLTVWLVVVTVPESLRAARPGSGAARPSLGVLQKSARRSVAVPVTRALMRLTAPRHLALVAGLPDTEENSLVTAAALAGRYPGEVVLVAGDPAAARIALDRVAALLGRDASRVRVVPKAGLATYRLFVRAELVAYTHGLYDSPRPVGRRLHVNLWHGTGPKWNANANFAQRIGAQAHAASSPLWGAEAIRALSVPADSRLVTGNPRQDVVAASTDRAKLRELGVDPTDRLVLWLPTFRRSARAGLVGLHEGEPIDAGAGRAFAAAAARHGVRFVAKPHRLDSELFDTFGVDVLTDEAIAAAGLTLYELLGLADGVLSDYSSVWLDVLDRPVAIGLYVPDLPRYQRERGLNRPDLAVAASGLVLTEDDADEFFASIGATGDWRSDARKACRDRIAWVDVAPGGRADALLDDLAVLAHDRFGTDLGLTRQAAQRRPVTSS